MNDELARAMYEGTKGLMGHTLCWSEHEAANDGVSTLFRCAARIALKELGITEERAERMEKGAVGKAIRRLVHAKLMRMRGHHGVAGMDVGTALDMLGWRLEDGKLDEEAQSG